MPTINFRMSEEQHAELQAAAKLAGRSLQRELEWRAFTRQWKIPPGARGPTEAEMKAISESVHLIPEDAADATWTPAASGSFRPEDGLTEEDVTEIVGLLENPAAPSVPPVPARRGRDEQRGRAAARPAKGPCPHRVPEGQFCKRCGA